MKILKNSERATGKGPADWFTGGVWIEPVVSPEAPSRLQAAYVTFTPGARTNWHTHPVSQILNVVSGFGWVQLEGEPAKRIAPGDVVVIGPGENHWHGADAGRALVHLAMQEQDEAGSVVSWGRPVSDEEYAAVR
ncbi:MAG: cupin domain-containing protein [Edaphobacter sp.]|uniref:(R)-mandelonitrile lyase n=1 Tax=Edaphobacter sp. TaxID=1934404 RepID=UPI00238DAE6C|nr:cupin domain-containing protein [Edaphobacter sp.]MDE1176207.1 cupin domain-containing protein [Edaphobacter sp.]